MGYQGAALDDGENGAEYPWTDEQFFLLPQMKMDVMKDHWKQNPTRLWRHKHAQVKQPLIMCHFLNWIQYWQAMIQ